MDEWKQRTDEVTINVDGHHYVIGSGGVLFVDDVEYEREASPELYALVYAFHDLDRAYAEDTVCST